MRSSYTLLILAISACALAQQPAAQRPANPLLPSPAQPPAAAANVAPSDPVLVLDNFCDQKTTTPASGPCRTTITRSEFDTLFHGIDPNASPASRGALADAYVKILVMAADGVKHGVLDDPDAKAALAFTRLQTLGQIRLRELQKEAQDVPAAEVEQYYNAHTPDFQEASMHRIFLPKNPPGDAKKLSDADLAALAERTQKRAAAGEDFKKLQDDAYTEMGIKTPAPPTEAAAQRRNTLPKTQQDAVFNLKPGEVSGVISDSFGDYIYRLDSLNSAPLPSVEPEIKRTLQGERYQKELVAIYGKITATTNPDYFGQNVHIDLPKAEPANAPEGAAAPSSARGSAAPGSKSVKPALPQSPATSHPAKPPQQP